MVPMNPEKTSRPPVPGSASSQLRGPSQEQVAALAHAIWIDRGRPEGRDLDNWLEAERQLRGENRPHVAADDIPASNEALDPEHALEGNIERELDRVVGNPPPRSPTSL